MQDLKFSKDPSKLSTNDTSHHSSSQVHLKSTTTATIPSNYLNSFISPKTSNKITSFNRAEGERHSLPMNNKPQYIGDFKIVGDITKDEYQFSNLRNG